MAIIITLAIIWITLGSVALGLYNYVNDIEEQSFFQTFLLIMSGPFILGYCYGIYLGRYIKMYI